MAFDPLRFESTTKETDLDNNENQININCKYVTNDQLNQMLSNQNGSLTLLNVNIRSIGKNLDTLKLCLKTLDHKFTVVALSETHLKDKPLDYYQLLGYNFEYINRVDRGEGGVGIFIANNVKYKLRHDLCEANPHFESCFIEIEKSNVKNVLIGVIYRAHTAIDNFVHDVDPILQTISKEKKNVI